MHSVFVICVCLLASACAVDLRGVWIEDGNNLGVYTLTADSALSYKVENRFWRQEHWHFGSLTINNSTSLVQLLFENGTSVTGKLWPSTGTHILWNNTISWHKYGSDVTCYQQTKKRISRDSQSLPYKAVLHENVLDEDVTEPRVDVTEVHVVIMTHFDLGYTDYAWCTISHYFWRIYPGIVETSLADPEFIFTTHPWILYSYFNCERLQKYIINVPDVDFICPTPSMVAAVEAMIKRGQMVWHSFAYDGFNEMLGVPLFSRAFDYAKWLSTKFGVPEVVTMSNIDIPGIYRAQLPTILNSGTKALYIGQNPFDAWAGAVLDLPNLFLWESPTNPKEKLLTMTHKLGYGGLTPFDAIVDPVSGHALVVQCVLENAPAYTPVDVNMYINKVKKYFPNAHVAPSTFDNFSKQLLEHVDKLPVLKQDIGDTWVRAIPSDPIKTSTFLNQRRHFEDCVSSGGCLPLQPKTMDEVFFLLSAPEHNFGLPCQIYSWEQAALSYQEKRDMLRSAERIQNERKLAVHEENPEKEKNTEKEAPFECAKVTWGPDAAITQLVWNGKDYADATHKLGLVYYTEHAVQGLKGEETTGWGDPVEKFLVYNSTPSLQTHSGDGCLLFTATSIIPQNDTETGPMILFHVLQFSPKENMATLTVKFTNKAMSYHFYATWTQDVTFGPAASIQFRPASTTSDSWTVTALDVEYSPSNFAANGTSHYHVVDVAKFSNKLAIRPLDTPLLLFGNASASWFTNWSSPPDYDAGAWFNVFNQWNGNWIVGWPWIEKEEVTARYEISLF
eukprot:TRINITY_DN15506_c0_g1_i1.p1 TRINITY_DN15506_c0_g1~~TRINITY_DN15506_c0_g1_i1.p1  ORF type:complete len:787 (-),score=136.21 TRINITY_DN15506_c0_g1_i1:30-2390(-)